MAYLGIGERIVTNFTAVFPTNDTSYSGILYTGKVFIISSMQKEFLFCAIKASLQAGYEIMKVYTDPYSDFEIEKKSDNSPLTIADKKANQAIVKCLKKTPYPILSEEGKMVSYQERSLWDNLWIVDPLDGTKEFIKKNGEFTVNIAFVEKGVPVAGVIFVPVTGILYFGDITLGAYKINCIYELEENDTLDTLIARSEHLSQESNKHDNFVIVASRSHLSPETEDYISRMKNQYPIVETITSGSSLKICLVAEGYADVYPRFAPTMEWDTAAGHAIAKAAGREIYNAETHQPLQYNKENLLNPWFIVKRVPIHN